MTVINDSIFICTLFMSTTSLTVRDRDCSTIEENTVRIDEDYYC
jgi:hypothetical protein